MSSCNYTSKRILILACYDSMLIKKRHHNGKYWFVFTERIKVPNSLTGCHIKITLFGFKTINHISLKHTVCCTTDLNSILSCVSYTMFYILSYCYSTHLNFGQIVNCSSNQFFKYLYKNRLKPRVKVTKKLKKKKNCLWISLFLKLHNK